MTNSNQERRQHTRWSLGTKILIGLLLGIATGLFFGELARPLSLLGDVFVGLLQMTVLPYIIVTLVANVGRLSVDRGKSLAGRAAAVWFVLTFAGMLVLVGMSLAFPERYTPSFFSASMGDSAPELDLLSLFVPSNIFRSLVDDAVPGVVFFCICVGIALIGLREKEGVIRALDSAGSAVARVNGFVMQGTPYGVFAIAAAASGTMTIEEFGRLRGYLLIFGLSTAILTFWLLPALVAALTPFRYRDVLRASRDALFTAFATGKVLVVLPMLIENTRRMFEEKALDDEETSAFTDVLYPLIYPFPSLGKLIALLFVPFAGAFVGNSLDLTDYVPLMSLGALSLFSGPILTIPFLLAAHELPADMFQLFILSGVLTSRLGDMVGVMSLIAFVTVTTCAMSGSMRIQWRKTGIVLGSTALVVLLASSGSHAWLESVKDDFQRDKVIASMHRMDPKIAVDARVLRQAAPNPSPLRAEQSRLSRVQEQRIIRVGYNDDNLPYVFWNSAGDLVGLDIEMAHGLANDLGASLVLVPFQRSTLAEQLAADHFDIAMSGLVGTIERSRKMRLSSPYLDATFSLVVRDHRARELNSYEEITSVDALEVGILTESQFARSLRLHVPNATTVVVPSTKWFFEEPHDLDALIISGEAGAAWSMLYPGYQVIVPTRRTISMPFVYAMSVHDEQFSEFVDFWVQIQRSSGRVDDLADYWIRGEGVVERKPRWSILRDVLDWSS